jgi:hypothetical protein
MQQVEDQPFEKYRRRLHDSSQQFLRNRTVDFRERCVQPFIGGLRCGGSAGVSSIIVAAVQRPRCDPRLANELPSSLIVKSVRMACK